MSFECYNSVRVGNPLILSVHFRLTLYKGSLHVDKNFHTWVQYNLLDRMSLDVSILRDIQAFLSVRGILSISEQEKFCVMDIIPNIIH